MQMQIYKAPRYADFRELFCGMATVYGRRPAFQLRVAEGKYTYISFIELRDRFYALCSAFLRAGLGGRHIAVIGKNRFEWVLAYVAAATVGVAVPLDKELSAADVKDFMRAADCAAICFDEEAAKKLYPTLDAGVQPYFFSEIAALSQPNSRTDFAAVNALEIPRDMAQILLFTSGTTGNSKGVCLSQFNICSVIYYSMRVIHFGPGDKTLSILPLHHTYESTMNCLYALSSGVCIAYCDGLTKIAKNAAEYQPTVLTVVPALLVALHKRIRASVIAGCPEKYKTIFETEPLAAALAKVPFFVRHAICTKVKKSLGGKQAYNNDGHGADEHGGRFAERYIESGAENGADRRCAGIDMLDEDVGRVARHHIAEQTAAHAGDGADKDQEKECIVVRQLVGGVDAYYGKNTEPERIHYQHHAVIERVVVCQQMPHLRDEDHDGHKDGKQGIDRLAEHDRRGVAQQNVAQRAAADRGGQA